MAENNEGSKIFGKNDVEKKPSVILTAEEEKNLRKEMGIPALEKFKESSDDSAPFSEDEMNKVKKESRENYLSFVAESDAEGKKD